MNPIPFLDRACLVSPRFLLFIQALSLAAPGIRVLTRCPLRRQRPAKQFRKPLDDIGAIQFLASRPLRDDLKNAFFVDARRELRRDFAAFAHPDRAMDRRTSNDSVTLVLTLFTFCPPGPPLRDAVKRDFVFRNDDARHDFESCHDDSAFTSRYKNSRPS